jgi:fission process protein 1
MFDEPVEHATEWVFHKAFEAIGGPAAVGKDISGGSPLQQEKEAKKEL